MADVITRFRAETAQFDSALRDASRQLAALTGEAAKTGAGFDRMTQGSVDAARALGNTAGSASDTRGKLRELVAAFNEAAKAYNALTEEQKRADFGKAMAESLERLRTRIADTKAEMAAAGSQMSATGSAASGLSGALEGIAGRLGLSIPQLGAMGVALGAVTAAATVAKDAFFKNEEQLDEWGRIVESAKSVYGGFLDALNTGDLSGFFGRMDAIVASAREAYDALDNLATYNAFNQGNMARGRADFQNVMIDYRDGAASADDVRSAADYLIGELQKRQALEAESYDAAIRRVAKERGVSAEDLAAVMKGGSDEYKRLKELMPSAKREDYTYHPETGQIIAKHTVAVPANEAEQLGEMLRRFNDTELEQLQRLGAQAYSTEQEINNIRRQEQRTLRTAPGGSAPATAAASKRPAGAAQQQEGAAPGSIDAQAQRVAALQRAWRAAANDSARDEIATQIRDATAELDRMTGKVKEAVTAESPLTEQTLSAYARQVSDAMATMDLGGADYLAAMANRADVATLSAAIKDTLARGIDIASAGVDASELWRQIAAGVDIPDEAWAELEQKINAKIDEIGGNIKHIVVNVDLDGVKDATNDATKMNEDWRSAASAVRQVGSAMQQIEDPVAKVAGTVAQAIASIALAASQAMAAKDTTSSGWAWIGAAAAITATMISTIAAVKSATAGRYAEGGIIPGATYSGDQLYASVNSGELILNRAQQGNLAAQLESTAARSDAGTPYATGETLYLALSNYLKRVGKGEIVTARR